MKNVRFRTPDIGSGNAGSNPAGGVIRPSSISGLIRQSKPLKTEVRILGRAFMAHLY